MLGARPHAECFLHGLAPRSSARLGTAGIALPALQTRIRGPERLADLPKVTQLGVVA